MTKSRQYKGGIKGPMRQEESHWVRGARLEDLFCLPIRKDINHSSIEADMPKTDTVRYSGQRRMLTKTKALRSIQRPWLSIQDHNLLVIHSIVLFLIYAYGNTQFWITKKPIRNDGCYWCPASGHRPNSQLLQQCHCHCSGSAGSCLWDDQPQKTTWSMSRWHLPRPEKVSAMPGCLKHHIHNATNEVSVNLVLSRLEHLVRNWFKIRSLAKLQIYAMCRVTCRILAPDALIFGYRQMINSNSQHSTSDKLRLTTDKVLGQGQTLVDNQTSADEFQHVFD